MSNLKKRYILKCLRIYSLSFIVLFLIVWMGSALVLSSLKIGTPLPIEPMMLTHDQIILQQAREDTQKSFHELLPEISIPPHSFRWVIERNFSHPWLERHYVSLGSVHQKSWWMGPYIYSTTWSRYQRYQQTLLYQSIPAYGGVILRFDNPPSIESFIFIRPQPHFSKAHPELESIELLHIIHHEVGHMMLALISTASTCKQNQNPEVFADLYATMMVLRRDPSFLSLGLPELIHYRESSTLAQFNTSKSLTQLSIEYKADPNVIQNQNSILPLISKIMCSTT